MAQQIFTTQLYTSNSTKNYLPNSADEIQIQASNVENNFALNEKVHEKSKIELKVANITILDSKAFTKDSSLQILNVPASANFVSNSPNEAIIIYSEATEVTRVEPEDVEDHSSNWDYYIIVGVFSNKANVRHYQKYLFETFNEKTQMMVNNQNYYYLFTKKISTNADATVEMQRISTSNIKNYLVGNPWLWRQPKQ